jgi:hypothetical protein
LNGKQNGVERKIMKNASPKSASPKNASQKYPLEERIGHPELLVGRKKEFARLKKWVDFMPMKLSQSIALLARKKSGKTAIVQRLFNQD